MSCYNRYRKNKKKGKKRRRKGKRPAYQQKQRGQMPKGGSRRCNCHHLIWQKRRWHNRNAKALREFWYCKVDIPAETIHRYIHEAMYEIPVASEPVCAHALREIKSLEKRGAIGPDDSPIKRLGLLICLLEGGNRETGKALREEREIFVEWEKQNCKPDEPTKE